MRPLLRLCLVLGITSLLALGAAARPLRVVATSPDLADLADRGRRCGRRDEPDRGAPGHPLRESAPTVTELHRADALVLIGMDLEIGCCPRCAARTIRRELAGYIGASVTIDPPGAVRARRPPMGDGTRGNPHY
jgi:hypothetical protein